MAKDVTMRDIAREMGVSTVTVSKALSVKRRKSDIFWQKAVCNILVFCVVLFLQIFQEWMHHINLRQLGAIQK